MHRTTMPRATVAAVGLLGLLGLVGCTRDPVELTTATTASVSSTSSPVTTVPASTAPPTTVTAPATTGPVTTVPATAALTAPPTPAPTTVPTNAPASTVASPISPAGSAWVLGVQAGDPQVGGVATDCGLFLDGIAEGPYSVAACGVWDALGGQRVWTITKGATGLFFAMIWQQTAPDVWSPRARLVEPEPDVWTGVVIKTENIDSGANDELVAGIRLGGTGGYLTLDVFDVRAGDPTVVARMPEVPKGIGVMRPGDGVEVWGAIFQPDDPGCCPSSMAQRFLRSSATGWILEDGLIADTEVAPLPPGDF